MAEASSKTRRYRITPRKRAFVAHYLETGCGATAAKMAGYSQRTSKNSAYKLLQDPWVKAEVDKGQRELRERNAITTDKMVDQFDEDRAFAFKTENATAAVRASELKAKLAGLLIDRVDARVAHGFSVVIEGIGDA